MKRILKVLVFGAAAGALKGLADTLPDLLPAGMGDLVAVAIAAVIGYILPQPKK